MAGRQKLIAVCLSQVHNYLHTGFLNELGSAAALSGYGIVVFNSSSDFYGDRKEDIAPRACFRSIRYDLFDAVFIVCHSLHDEGLVREIADGARAHHVPVILAGMELPGCFSVVNDYEDGYKAVIRHVIRDHGALDTFFIAGIKGEANSEGRLKCYREVLKEFGLPFRPYQVAYGNYWSRPTVDIIRKLIRSQRDMPDAIFCANDTMAITVCDTLRENGFRVPEDVIVTGFDGIPAAYMVRPRLTTCTDNPRMLAEQIIDLVLKTQAGNQPPSVLAHSFSPVYSESCGCPCPENDRFDALSVYRRSEALNNHENDLYHTVERLLLQKEPEAFLKMISTSILPDSYICLNRRFLDIYSGIDYSADSLEEDLICIPSREDGEDLSVLECRLSEIRPPEGLETGITVFNTLHAGSVVYGFYAAHTRNLDNDAQLIKRLSDVLDMVLMIQLGNARQQLLIHHLDNSIYLDSVTGLSNLRGLTRWFEDYASKENSRLRPLALSVYSIYRYNYIYENYGMNETEDVVRLIAGRLVSSDPDALIIARISSDQFAVVDSGDTSDTLSRAVARNASVFFHRIESDNSASSRLYFIEVNRGCTTLDSGWTGATLENLIRLAAGEMNLNRLRSSRAVSKSSAFATDQYSSFDLMMEKHLYRFLFQPIVDAKNAQVLAYEALMQIDGLIGMTPLEMLAVAREYNRLYDVERATFFGVMEYFVQHFSSFSGNKVFINTIPGHFLNEEDCAAVKARFDNYLDCFVYELTEQDATPEKELYRLKSLSKTGSSAQIAIDDYGAGHSNIVNVMRCAPQIIKIDKALISGIQHDRNKQLFVRNTIEFAHQNGIRALAEGVETVEELRAVIDYGIDLIQGFYTGRPSEQPVPAVSEEVRREILAENLLLTRFNREMKVFYASDGDVLSLLDLAMEHYTCVQVSGGHVELAGQETQSVDMLIRTADNTDSVLTLRNANLKGVNATTVCIGNRSSLLLQLEGRNTLNKEGILVPASSSLTLRGTGDLTILNNRNYSVGIGANYNDPYGTIVADMEGTLTIRSAGDKVVCFGGGQSAGEGITLLRGTFRLSANGISVVGLGSAAGSARIRIQDASVSVLIEGNDALGIGSLSDQALVRSSGELDVTVNSERAAGIGSMSGTGDILLEGGSVSAVIHCDAGACIGTFTGDVSARVAGACVRVHGEGNRVAGLGSTDGTCDTRIESGDVSGDVLAGDRMLIGNTQSTVIITGGNVCLSPDDGRTPVSPGGLPLYCRTPREDHFEQACRDSRSSWIYTADRNPEGFLSVWLPEKN